MRAPAYSDRADELFDSRVLDDPHPLFARLRLDCPISRVGDTGVHLVASWDLVEEALGREADFSANLTGVLLRGPDGAPTVFELPDVDGTRVIATADEPEHAVHRALAQPRLAAARVASFEDPLRSWTRDALLPWVAAGAGDFIPLAERIPAQALARLLGLPDDDVSRHRAWAMVGGAFLAGDLSLDEMALRAAEAERMTLYLADHLDRARSELQSGVDASLLHSLAAGTEAGNISSEQAVAIATVMFGAGGESPAALIGSAARRLAEDPALAEVLRRAPTKIGRFVEEVARLEPPFKFHYRAVRRACRLGGFALEPGDRLMLLWASANRDATRFEDPDLLRLDRRHPKQHLGFGRGSHFCIGAPLARLEARVVCEELLAATANLSLRDDDPPYYARSIFVRRLDRLALRAA